MLVEQRMHPQVIIKGYRIALAAARERLETLAIDNGKDLALFREDLLRIARTGATSGISAPASTCVDAGAAGAQALGRDVTMCENKRWPFLCA